MLRRQAARLPRLGHGFSVNGDHLSMAFGTAAQSAANHSAGSCSDQPKRGTEVVTGWLASPRT